MGAQRGDAPRIDVAITVYHYQNCSTCKKARKWLDARGVAYTPIDIVREPPSKATLERLWKSSGLPLRKLFNVSGESYRAGGFKEKLETMSEAEALAALAADGKLIKRPLIDGGDFALVGWDERRYAERFPT
jgi:arsenate reductase